MKMMMRMMMEACLLTLFSLESPRLRNQRMKILFRMMGTMSQVLVSHPLMRPMRELSKSRNRRSKRGKIRLQGSASAKLERRKTMWVISLPILK